jgi:hypothetical protein
VRTTRCAIVAAILSAVFVAGCGGAGDESRPVDLTKQTDTSAFKGMLGDQMKSANLKESKSAKSDQSK